MSIGYHTIELTVVEGKEVEVAAELRSYGWQAWDVDNETVHVKTYKEPWNGSLKDLVVSAERICECPEDDQSYKGKRCRIRSYHKDCVFTVRDVNWPCKENEPSKPARANLIPVDRALGSLWGANLNLLDFE